jgi:HK97 gp10 family phage protein
MTKRKPALGTYLTITGMDETIDYLRGVSAEITGPSLLEGMRQATATVTRAAKQNAPVDLNDLRSSIKPSIRRTKTTVLGVVGSNVKYAPFMEMGTKPFWPKVDALQPWARRHGMSAFLVARAIARRGLKPRKYLQRAFEDNVHGIYKLIQRSVDRAIKK